MSPKCPDCPIRDGVTCYGLESICERVHETAVRVKFIDFHARAIETAAEAMEAAGVPLADSIRAARIGYRACLYSSHEGCGCSGTHCYHLGRVVGLPDCLECLSIKRS
jgi:hypothetical protein